MDQEVPALVSYMFFSNNPLLLCQLIVCWCVCVCVLCVYASTCGGGGGERLEETTVAAGAETLK